MEANYFTILYWFCHTSTWICHRCTRVPHLKPPSRLSSHTIPLGHPSAPARSILYHASNLDWRFISHMILYVFQCHSPKSSNRCFLPQSQKDCSIHLYLFCCLAYRVIVTIFLNSIYMLVSILYWCFSFWLTSLCIIGSSFNTLYVFWINLLLVIYMAHSPHHLSFCFLSGIIWWPDS